MVKNQLLKNIFQRYKTEILAGEDDSASLIVSATDPNLVVQVDSDSDVAGASLVASGRQPSVQPNQLFEWDNGRLRCRLSAELFVSASKEGKKQVTVQHESNGEEQSWKIL